MKYIGVYWRLLMLNVQYNGQQNVENILVPSLIFGKLEHAICPLDRHSKVINSYARYKM